MHMTSYCTSFYYRILYVWISHLKANSDFNIPKYKYIFYDIHRGLNVIWECFKHTRLQRIGDFFSKNTTWTWSISLHLMLHYMSSQSNYVAQKVFNLLWPPSIAYVMRRWHPISISLLCKYSWICFFSIHHFKLYIGFYKHLLIYLQIKMVGIQKLISSNTVLNESIYTCCLMTSYQYGSVKNS